MRTTLVLSVRNEPGALLRVLRVFADSGINLSKLESRPSRVRAWEYVFWIDLDADPTSDALPGALDALRDATTMVRVLGRYPRVVDS
jgi:chorismate mutase/prephenate dehydratase